MLSPTPTPTTLTPPPFFGSPVYLTVSGQLHLEAMALALSRVYCLGPTFRAEDSNTPRHLSEFWMLEAELAPAGAGDAMALAERCLKAACLGLLEERPGDVAALHAAAAAAGDGGAARRRLEAVAAAAGAGGAEFARMSYSEAVRALSASARPFRLPAPRWGEGLAHEHERWLAEEHCGGRPVFVTDYPAAVKPFYMRRGAAASGGEEGGATVECFDLLVPGVGELAGGSAREERFELLAPLMRERGLLSPGYGGGDGAAAEPGGGGGAFLDWYLDLRRFGGAPHAGFGMGFERLVLFATGVANVRDTIAFPRVPGRCAM